MNSKSLVNCFVWNHFEKFERKEKSWGPQELCHRFMYIHVAPSRDCSLLTLNLPFKVILSENAAFFK